MVCAFLIRAAFFSTFLDEWPAVRPAARILDSSPFAANVKLAGLPFKPSWTRPAAHDKILAGGNGLFSFQQPVYLDLVRPAAPSFPPLTYGTTGIAARRSAAAYRHFGDF
jgi:hypothetical protein